MEVLKLELWNTTTVMTFTVIYCLHIDNKLISINL